MVKIWKEERVYLPNADLLRVNLPIELSRQNYINIQYRLVKHAVFFRFWIFCGLCSFGRFSGKTALSFSYTNR